MNDKKKDRHDDGEELEPLLTSEEVAEILKVSTRHVTKSSAKNSFPSPIRLGRSVRFRASDIRCWIRGDWMPPTGTKI